VGKQLSMELARPLQRGGFVQIGVHGLEWVYRTVREV
jgi:hypothetical protein